MPVLSAPGANRRSSRRQPSKKSTKVTCQKGSLGLGPNLALSVLDLSETGVRMMVREALPLHQDLTITLSAFGQRHPLPLMGKVVWSVPAANGGFCIGVRFEKSIPYADLQLLVNC